jgi:hypothetical protein
MIKKIIVNLILGSVLIGNSVDAACFEKTNTPPLENMIHFKCSEKISYPESENLEELYDAFRWVLLTAEFIQDVATMTTTGNGDLDQKIILELSKIERIIDQKWTQNKHLKKNAIVYQNTKRIVIEDFKPFNIKDPKCLLEIFYSTFDDCFKPLDFDTKLRLQQEADRMILDILNKEFPQ